MAKNQSEKPYKIFTRDISPVFSNYTQVTHTDGEFSFTFIHLFLRQTEEAAQGEIKAVVTTTPKHAKRILHTLQANIKLYESKSGEIKLPEEKEEPQLSYRA